MTTAIKVHKISKPKAYGRNKRSKLRVRTKGKERKRKRKTLTKLQH